jgi:superfamily II RNA helicase
VIESVYRTRFIDSLGFGLDRFQLEAIEAIDEHVNVLVSAPTGSLPTTPLAESSNAENEPSTRRP